jgi:hypothetical protein
MGKYLETLFVVRYSTIVEEMSKLSARINLLGRFLW